jgi:hypothetical protein
LGIFYSFCQQLVFGLGDLESRYVTARNITSDHIYPLSGLPQTMAYDAPPKDGQEALARLRDVIKTGKPIVVGAGAGVGISAKFIEQGGADLLILC